MINKDYNYYRDGLKDFINDNEQKTMTKKYTSIIRKKKLDYFMKKS
jgi:hypothetical protein